MPNEEIIIVHNPDKVCHLRIKRKWHFIECLSRVIVYINGLETATIKNGEEITIPVPSDSVIELDLQSPALHNYYILEITGIPMIEFSFSWFGSGSFFKYNNIKVRSHFGCRITEKGKEFSQRQKLDNKMSFWFIGILMAAYVALQLAQCVFKIHL